MIGHVLFLDQTDPSAFGEGGMLTALRPASAAASRLLEMRGIKRRHDLRVEAFGEVEIARIELSVADRLRDGEMGYVLAEISTVQIDEAVGVARPIIEQRPRDGLCECAVGSARKAEIDVLVVERTEVLRSQGYGRQIDNGDNGDSAPKGGGREGALQPDRRFDA